MDQSMPPEKVAQPIGYSSRSSGSVEEETGMPVSSASPQKQINLSLAGQLTIRRLR